MTGQIEPRRRPAWVDEIIQSIDQITMKQLSEVSVLLGHDITITRISGGPSAVIYSLESAAHDMAHLYEHLVEVRRGLKASWPDERDSSRG